MNSRLTTAILAVTLNSLATIPCAFAKPVSFSCSFPNFKNDLLFQLEGADLEKRNQFVSAVLIGNAGTSSGGLSWHHRHYIP